MRWKSKYKPEWSAWFAWHPIKIGDIWVWLEIVERRVLEMYAYQYRFKIGD